MIGTTVSHYKILEHLGSGGMGVVYKAEDTRLKRTVALKFLPPALTCNPEAKARFSHEAQAASALDHPSICTIHDVGETEDGQMYLVMACYEGKTLKEKIEQEGPLDIDLALDIAIQIADGLARAHEAGIVHRDIKPANLFLTTHNEVKILDFGLAKLAGQSMLTKTGSTLGTAAYMSPEQAKGEPVDHRTDVWSLGVVLYEMLTGKRPFESDYEQALVYSILNQQATPIRESRPEVPEVVEQIVARAMAKTLQDRYQHASELLADLKIVRGEEAPVGTVAAAVVADRKKRRRFIKRSIIMGAALTVILLALLLAWPFVQDQLLASSPKTITVISFENQTGDKSQDHIRNVLQDAIITSLEQSTYLHVTTRQHMADILKQMGKSDVKYVDSELGLEICRREKVELLAVGTYARVGELYRTTLKLIDVRTLGTVRSYDARGTGIESLLEKQVDDLSRKLSRGIGVSERKTQEQIRPVAEISTTSIEAYQLYLRGVEEQERWYHADACRFLELAVQKDSLFAAAWFFLGCARSDVQGSNDAFKKAASLAWRASEKERFMIAYWDDTLRDTLLRMSGVTKPRFLEVRAQRFPREKMFLVDWAMALWLTLGRTDEAIAVMERALELDPTYGYALANLAYAYADRGEWEKSIETLKGYALSSPGNANPYDSMGDIYYGRQMYDEAMASYRQALAVKPDWYVSADRIMWYCFVKEDYEGALQWIDTSASRDVTPGHQARQMWERALVAFWQGRLNKSERILRKLEAMLATSGQRIDPGLDFLSIWIALERRQFARSRLALNAWGDYYERGVPTEHRRIRRLFVRMYSGFIDLAEGKLDEATGRIPGIDSIRAQIPPADTSINTRRMVAYGERFSGILQSEWLMASGRIQEAITARPNSEPDDLASGPLWVWKGGFLPGVREALIHPMYLPMMVDLLPRAYFALGQLDSSVAAYERALSDPTCNRPIFPRYHYRLAVLYEMKGMREKAIEQYETFLKIWGKADPIYKEPADARARLARLIRSNSQGAGNRGQML